MARERRRRQNRRRSDGSIVLKGVSRRLGGQCFASTYIIVRELPFQSATARRWPRCPRVSRSRIPVQRGQSTRGTELSAWNVRVHRLTPTYGHTRARVRGARELNFSSRCLSIRSMTFSITPATPAELGNAVQINPRERSGTAFRPASNFYHWIIW